ncbi:MAG TPA: RrF2 family transcriptional regulator [Candidatus Aerophobetes bacterium]|uniref:RrF2 family transcriptional regulator n=1 Tax=Aerophobetes bacterium TaxID=2030807 RepID=A0A7V5M0E8_UNCAE|nr:RrF2 family transcriptional regulator [Candidatus Aerophobetes bacterium]
MKVSTKGRYGLRAMVELAKNYGSFPLSVKSISQSQNVSFSYMEQILNRLNKARLVRSIKGVGGGFILARRPENIKIIEILSALEDTITPVFCVENPESCKKTKNCVAHLFWKKLDAKIKEVLRTTTLKDLCEWEKKRQIKRDEDFLMED